MAFIGNTPTQQAFTPAIDYFSGNGSTTAFTLSRPVASVAQVQVTIDNVAQNPSSAYTVSANTITFTSAPLSGTNNIYVYYTSPITDVIAPGQGTVTTTSLNTSSLAIPAANVTGITPAMVSDQTNTSTGYFDLPAGTTAQRPGSPATGMVRYNTTESTYEVYTGTAWQSITTAPYTYSASYLIIAGGGGGSHSVTPPQFSGGGAGGVLTSTVSVSAGTTYTITVGAAGAAGGSNGTNSTAFSLTAIGGGGGGGGGMGVGGSGGSGGGQGGSGGGGTPNNAAGTSGQGNQGGSGTGPQDAAGGGGGQSSAGGNASGSTPGNGGAGLTSSISGTSTKYAGGGGTVDQGFRGGYSGAPNAIVNSGSGGAGSAGSGASGIVIISYAGAQRGTGGTVTTSGGNTIHTFTTSGTYIA